MKLNVARFLRRSNSEGPGWRAVIWVQGCPIRCEGCCNPQMLPFVDKDWRDTDALVEEIRTIPDIEGVTFVGGEPFAQAAAVASVAQGVRQSEFSVVVFTGYTLEHIRSSNNQAWKLLLEQVDLLLAGPFIQTEYSEDLPWIGSSNQELHFLTPRYRHLENKLRPTQTNSVELHLTSDGKLHINGFAFADMLPTLLEALKVNQVQTEQSNDFE